MNRHAKRLFHTIFIAMLITGMLCSCGKMTHLHLSSESSAPSTEHSNSENTASSGGGSSNIISTLEELISPGSVAEPYSFEALKQEMENCVQNGISERELTFSAEKGAAENVEADIRKLINETFSVAFFTESVSYSTSYRLGKLTVALDITFNERQPEYSSYMPGGTYHKGAWSEETLVQALLSAASAKTEELTLVFDAADGIDRSALLSAAGRLENENEYLLYYIKSSQGKAWDFDEGLVLYLALTYNEEASHTIYDIDGLSDLAVVSHLIDTQTDWTEKYVLHYTDEIPWEHLVTLAEMASANDCADLVCLMDTYYTSEYGGENGTITELTCRFPDGLDDRNAYLSEMRAAISSEADAAYAEYGGGDAEDLYLGIVWRLCDYISYDDALADAISADSYTTEQQYALTAWGALCKGETVCSGYASAFKAVCDKLGLPCWVINGSVADDPLDESEGHAWNAVLLDGTVYYIDITFYDATGDDRYLFFTDSGMGGRMMDEGWFLPW